MLRSFCIALVLAVPSMVLAQDALVHREFRGMETLRGYGSVTFRFQPNGKVEMIDVRQTLVGTYTMDVLNVEIRFSNCVYKGAFNGAVIVGDADFLDRSAPWKFQVQVTK